MIIADGQHSTGKTGESAISTAGGEAVTLTGIRVTIIGVHYAPESTGNAPYTTALAESLVAAGAQVRVITGVPHYPQWAITDPMYRKGLRWRETRNGVKVIRVRHHVPAVPNLIGRAGLEVTFLVQSLLAAGRDSGDVLIAITPTLSGLATTLLRRRRRPVGVLIQDLTGASAVESGTSTNRVGGMIARAEYALLRRADRVGVITPRFQSILVGAGVPANKIIDLPNFTHVDPVQVSPAEARERLGWPDRYSVVHTGNMGMKQGLETVVEAALLAERAGSDVQFVLVGDGNQRQALQQRAGICRAVKFVDPLSARDYPYALAAADALLVNERPGVREMSLPSKLTSYTVAGRPIVAAIEADGITAEALNRHRSALLCGAGDPAGLLGAIARLRASAQDAGVLINGARALHDEDYGASAAIARYQNFVRELQQLGASR